MNWVLQGEEKRYSFIGAFNNQVELVLYPKTEIEATHVVLLAVYQQSFLFTKHKLRGIEWPGGKLKKGESLIEAAKRELFEETGATCSKLWSVGYYKVMPSNEAAFTKYIFAANIDTIIPNAYSGEDTDGPVLVGFNIDTTKEKSFSPIVSDAVFPLVRETICDWDK